MDCPSEENMIRMKLNQVAAIQQLNFDLEKRMLTVFHDGQTERIGSLLSELNMDSKQVNSEQSDQAIDTNSGAAERKLLWAVLAINFGFFLVELISGLLAHSMGLVADSLDMLADAIVYGLSIWAVGSVISRKKKVATLSGYFQLMLALAGLLEIVRRFFSFEQQPDFHTMIYISAFALIGNAACLYLLQKSKSQDAHMKASMIFTSNDVVINIGVILAGFLVLLTNSKYPDLIIGSIIFLIVTNGAFRILKLGK
ncbi:MAG TPA: cation transporter [Sunxiuqinia sp.]|nr:cation transporter [Sunxiuqinia sp.]